MPPWSGIPLTGLALRHEGLRAAKLLCDLGLSELGLLAGRDEEFAQLPMLRRVDRLAHVGR